MYLKQLKIQGFKSFAQKTQLDFQKGISVVVGPNGSGKSNIADALRFVLGEQGMKNVRAKKSQDLIFSGSGTKPKMNMAYVELVFDNKGKVFPVDFSEVSIARKIFRDGENKYFINNSQVRLKDLSEFIAKAKLGLKGYTIVNQGMGDHILNASLKERKEIIDEALGLREFQIKRNDAVLKLAQTETNLEKTESLIRELSPHLKFLTKQVEKLDEKKNLQNELEVLKKKFIEKKEEVLKKSKNFLEEEIKKLKDQLNFLKQELETVQKDIQNEESKVSGFFGDLESLENSLFEVEKQRSVLQRELGKVEGAIDLLKNSNFQAQKHVSIDLFYVKEKLELLKKLLKKAIDAKSFEQMKESLLEFSRSFSELSDDVSSGKVKANDKKAKQDKSTNDKLQDLQGQKEKLQKELKKFQDEFYSIQNKIKKINAEHHKEKENIFSLKNKEKDIQTKILQAKNDLYQKETDLKRINSELSVLNLSNVALDSIAGLCSQKEFSEVSAIFKSIERINIRLETAEMIDESVLDEYNQTKSRMEFLQKEVSDLKEAIEKINVAIKELNLQIEDKFNKSFLKINKNFNKYFNILFGGGSAKLEIVKQKDEEEKNKKDTSFGIDIFVSLPGKKVNSVSALSGGERTLSSLALLFALVFVSPPPFMVLDEIDAPLDEANASRFLKILNELKDNTQFVIVSHNRETMRQADILYGVTMQNDGISKLLSLKFEEAVKTLD